MDDAGPPALYSSGMIGRLNHVGVATPSIAESVKLYRDVLGATQISAVKAMPAKGATVLNNGVPRIGAHGTPVIFVHPRNMGGVLVELMETPKGGHA